MRNDQIRRGAAMKKMKKVLYTAGVLIGTIFLVTAGANEKETLELLPDYKENH